MADKGKRKTLAEVLYKANVSPLSVMPSFDKNLIMKRIEDPPFDNENEKEKSSK